MRSFASKYAPSQYLVVNRILKANVPLKPTTIRFMTTWELMREAPEALLALPG